MRRPPRLLAAATLAVLALPFGTVGAAAHDNGSIHPLNWGPDAPADGVDVWGPDFITVQATFDDGIWKWRIEMRPEAGGDPSYCEEVLTSGATEDSRNTNTTLRCNWDTLRSGDMTELGEDEPLTGAPLAVNGRYVLTATVWNGDGDCGLLCNTDPHSPHHLDHRTVTVVNPVSAPTGVGRSFNSNTRKITVSWKANPEPDIVKYLVEEKVGSGAWKPVGERPGTSTSYEKTVSSAGTYQYRVAAVRPEVAASSWVAAPPIEVAKVPPTTSTTGGEAEAPGSEPEPGVFIPEPETTTTTAGPGETPRSFGNGSSLFTRPSVTTSPPATSPRSTTPTTIDTGYEEALPYKVPEKDPEPLPDEGELAADEPRTIERIINVPTPRDPRALLVPLAGGLAIFVLAMQITYAVRRRPALAPAEDDFGDWSGI